MSKDNKETNKNNKTFEIFSTLNFNNNEVEFCISGDSIKNGKLNEYDDSLANSINNALKNVFEKYNKQQLENYNKFKDLIDKKQYDSAYDIFIKNMFFGYDDFFEYLERINFDSIADKNKVAILMLTKCKIKEDNKQFEYIATKVPKFLNKYKDFIEDKDLINEFEYIIAFANYNLNKKELALLLLNQLLEKKNINNSIKRRIYGIKSNIEQNTKYLEVAGDIALEEGNIKETIALKMNLVDKLICIEPSKAIEIIENLEQLCKVNDIKDNIMLAKLLFNKANYLFSIKDYEQALGEIEKAIKSIDNIAGDDIINSRYSYYALGLQLAENLNIEDKIGKFQKELTILKEKIKTTDFAEQLNIPELIINKKYDELNLLKHNQLENGNYYTVFLINMALVVNEDTSFTDKISLLDEIKTYTDKIPLREIDKALIYHTYAHIFLQEKMYDKFIEYANISLQINPYNPELRHNYIVILQQEDRWPDIEKFCKDSINRFGELPNIMFLYAKSICIQNSNKDKLGMAITILSNIISKLDEDIKNEATQILIQQTKKGIEPNNKFYQKEQSNDFVITLSDFESAIDDFKKNIEEKVRMSFWVGKKEAEDGHQYIENPETMAKTNFISFFNSRFGNNVRIIDECSAGAGFIDIYLIFSTFTVVVELKMCGHRYNSTYALSGKEQLKHYLDNSDSRLGYLLIFDSRIRDYSKYLNETIDNKNYTIITKAIDIRPKVKL